MTTKNDSPKPSKKDDAPEKEQELQAKIDELTLDLKRTRADFENYRKRIETEKDHARAAGKSGAILKLLPVIDNIERAIQHAPEGLKDNKWAQGVVNLVKNLEKSLESLEVRRIEAKKGTAFDPGFHEAIQFDEDAEGDQEIIDEELQAGYMLGDTVVRHSMVKVTRK